MKIAVNRMDIVDTRRRYRRIYEQRNISNMSATNRCSFHIEPYDWPLVDGVYDFPFKKHKENK